MTLPTVTFTGLATPFDAGALLDQLLAAERIPLQQLESRKSDYQAKDKAWQDVNTRISALRTALDAIDFDGFLAATSSDEESVSVSVTGTPSEGALAFSVDALALAHQMKLDTAITDPTDLTGSGTFTLTVGGTPTVLTLDGTTTFNDLSGMIISADVGVTSTVLEVTPGNYTLLLQSTSTGATNTFTVDSTATGLGSADWSIVQAGANAQISMGTLTIERASNTVTDLYPGLTINLDAITTGDVTITVDRDPTAAGEKVKALIDELNNSLTTLSTYTDYNIDTGTGGVLVGDGTARSLMNSLRSAVSGAVGGTSGNLVSAAVGISIQVDGSFVFDREKFESATAADFDDVQSFFETEVITDLDTALDAAEGVDGSIQRARDRWLAEIDYVDDRIADWEDRMDRREAALLRQFAQLDTALAQLNSMSQWLGAQLTASNSSS